jgi:hypothetical protein
MTAAAGAEAATALGASPPRQAKRKPGSLSRADQAGETHGQGCGPSQLTALTCTGWPSRVRPKTSTWTTA